MDEFSRASELVAVVVMPEATFQSPVPTSARSDALSRWLARTLLLATSGVARMAWRDERESVESNEFDLTEGQGNLGGAARSITCGRTSTQQAELAEWRG